MVFLDIVIEISCVTLTWPPGHQASIQIQSVPMWLGWGTGSILNAMTINLDIHQAGQHIRLKITSNECVSMASFSNMRLTWAAQRKHFFAWTLAQLSGELSWVLVTQYRLENERLCSVQSYRLLKIYTSITAGLHFCSWAMGEQSAQDPKKTDFFNQLLD